MHDNKKSCHSQTQQQQPQPQHWYLDDNIIVYYYEGWLWTRFACKHSVVITGTSREKFRSGTMHGNRRRRIQTSRNQGVDFMQIHVVIVHLDVFRLRIVCLLTWSATMRVEESCRHAHGLYTKDRRVIPFLITMRRAERPFLTRRIDPTNAPS